MTIPKLFKKKVVSENDKILKKLPKKRRLYYKKLLELEDKNKYLIVEDLTKDKK